MKKVLFNQKEEFIRGENLTKEDFIGVKYPFGKSKGIMVYDEKRGWFVVNSTDVSKKYSEKTLKEYAEVETGTQLYKFETFADLCKWVSE